MKKSVLMAMALLTFSSMGFAKMTTYRSIDAIKSVVESQDLKDLILKHGDVSNIAVTQKADMEILAGAVNEDFEMTITLSQETPIGVLNCKVDAVVAVGRNEVVFEKYGVSATELKAPKFSKLQCEK